jgi:hypothetical protein
MSASRRRISRVAPATAYVAATELATVTPAFNCTLAIEISADVAVIVYHRINGVNIELNDGVPIPANRAYTIYTMASPADAATIRLSVNCNINKFYVDEIDTDI